MTGFDVSKALTTRDTRYDRAILDAVMRPVVGNTPSTPSTSLWQDTLHLLGKGEEIPSKLLGQLFTDDPKYDDAFGSSDYWSQIGFYELAKDAGVNQENLGTAGPALAAILGLAAAVINPLDPLNKLKILGLTKQGVVGRRVNQALDAPENALMTIKGPKTEISTINKFASKDSAAHSIPRLEKELASGGLTTAARKHKLGSLKRAEQSVKDVDEINELLVKMQRKGMSLDDIKLAPTRLERIRRGQQNALGFSSPLKMDHLSLFGVAKSEIDHATVTSVLPGTRKAEATLVKGVDRVGKAVGSGVGKVGRDVLSKLGLRVIESERHRKIAALVKQMFRLRQGNISLYKSDMNNIRQTWGVHKEEFLEIANKLEQDLPDTLVLKEIIGEMPDSVDPAFRAGKGIRELTEEQAEELGVRFGSRITEDEKLILTPSGIDPVVDLPKAVDQFTSQADYPAWPLKNGNRVKLTGEFVVMEPATEAAAVSDINALNKVLGQRTYVKTKGPDGKDLLVARRLPGGVPVSSTSMFEYQHMDNLEAILAKLALQKKSVEALDPEDLLINPLGGVQIINPDKIIEYTGKGASTKALHNSSGILDLFVEQNTLIGRGGGLREYPFLKDIRAARKAPKVATSRRVRDGHEAESQNVHDLISEAVNLGPARDLLRTIGDGFDPRQIAGIEQSPRDVLRLSGIEQEFKSITRQISRGEAPVIKPITVSVDARGNLFVVEGTERAVAAAMAGMDVVPTVTRKLYGEALDLTKAHYVGRTMDAKEFFHGAEAGRAIVRDTALEEAGMHIQAVVSPNYKIIDEGGEHFARLDPSALGGRQALNTQNAGAVLASLGSLSTVGLRAGRGLKDRPQFLARKLVEIYGSEGSAAAAVSDLVASSSDASDFTSRLHRLVGALSNRNNIARSATTPEAVEKFDKLRKVSNANLEELSSRGIICNSCIKDQRHRDLFLQANPGKTLVTLDDATNTITYANYGKDAGQVKNIANAAFNAVGGAEEVAPLTKIRLRSRGGEAVEEVVREAKDFVSTPHPRLAQVITQQAEGIIDPKEIIRLRNEHGIYRNPKSTDPIFIRGPKGTIGVPLKQTAQGVKRQNIPFIITRAGDMFISTKYDEVPGLMGAMFGEGPRFFQESGIITARGIVLDNPLGAIMPKVGKSEVKALERRIRDIAGKLDDMGVHNGMRLHINVPFDGGVWSKMYGDKTTLAQVLKRGWKLDIPELLNDMPLDITASTSQRVIGTREPRFKNKNAQKLFEKLQSGFDEQFIEEFLASVSTSFHSSYYPRFATKEAKDAFNAAALDYISSNPKVVKHIEPFLKKRTFTDLTTEDINEIVKTFGRADKPGITPEGLLEDIMKHARDKLGKEIDTVDAEKFLSLVESMPSGVKFFHDDVIHAAILRFESGQKALLRQEVVQELTEKGVMWSGTPTELSAVLKGRTESLRPLEEAVTKVKEDIARIEGELSTIPAATPDIPQPTRAGTLRNNLADKRNELAAAEAKVSKEYGKFVDKNGTVADHIDRGQIFISGEDAERLISQGIVSPDVFPRGVDDTLVRVPFEQVTTALPGQGIKIHAFDPEVAAIANRFFGLETKGGMTTFLKSWDYMHDLWRTWTLFPVPAFHFRNALSSFTMNYLGGIVAPKTYDDTMRVFGILDKKNKGVLNLAEATEAMESLEYFNSIGQRATARDLWGEFVQRGGPQGGFYVNEYSKFGNLQRADEATRLGVRHGLVPSSEAAGSVLADNFAIRGGMRVGTAIESRMRFAAFLETWQKSGSFDAAERAVKSIHYDYSDLNAFERDVMRRVIPFYSWSRHNIPQMFKTMVTNPVAHIRLNRMIHQIEQGATGRVPRDESGIPEYIKNKYGFILHKGRDGKYFMKVGEGIFPIFDAYKILGGSAMEVIGQGVTPFAKFPIEQLANHSFFTGRDIENIPGEPSTRRFTLGAVGFSRRVTAQGPLGVLNLVANDSVVRDFFRVGSIAANLLEDFIDPKNWVDGEPTVGVAMWDLFLGRGKVVDPERTRAAVAFKRREMLGHLKRARKYYDEVGNTWLTGELDNRIMNFVLEHGGEPSGR